jgi:ribosome biogenesis GTPase
VFRHRAPQKYSLPDPQRLESYRALQKELRYLERRQDVNLEQIEKQKWRSIHREMRRSGRHRR